MMVNDDFLLFFDDFVGRAWLRRSLICSPSGAILSGGSRSGDPLLELAEAGGFHPEF